MNLSEHIGHFLQYIADRRRFSPRTVDTYRKSLTKFLEHLGNPRTGLPAGIVSTVRERSGTLRIFGYEHQGLRLGPEDETEACPDKHLRAPGRLKKFRQVPGQE
ncbi:site-specific integrase [Fibrobacter sp.]|uniref:site-specific integrase n=1 Tax=Fibrobacter sp. TaxID=35828 RepID=UPI00345D9184